MNGNAADLARGSTDLECLSNHPNHLLNLMNMTGRFVDGYLQGDLAIFGEPGKAGFASCGFEIDAPNLGNASTAYLNQVETELRSLLRLVKAGIRMQVSWALHSDCSGVLLNYYDQTKAGSPCGFTKNQRDERFNRYGKRMESGDLRFERVRIYFSVPFNVKGGFEGAIAAAQQTFASLGAEMVECLGRLGAGARRLSEEQLFGEMFRYLNPSQGTRTGIEMCYDPTLGIMANCLSGEANAVVSTDAGFFMDGHYFAFVLLKGLPQETCSGIIQHLTKAPIGNFGITVNIVPLDALREVEKEEAEINKLRRALGNGAQERAAVALSKRSARVQRLTANEEVPFQAQFVVRVWAPTQEELNVRIGVIKSSITSLQLAKYYTTALPTSARNYFRCAFPGWVFDSCIDFFHKIEDAPLANLIPLSGSPPLGHSEALYDGASGNIIGVNTFQGPAGSESPQHAVILGRTGSGKSAFVVDLLTQTDVCVDHTFIVDNGLSYQAFAQTLDEEVETLEIRADGQITLNYLDTCGAPLSNEHLAGALSVVHAMAGRKSEPDADRHRAAVIGKCLTDFFRDFAQDRLATDATLRDEVCRFAAVLNRLYGSEPGLSLAERLERLSQWADVQEMFESVSEPEISGIPPETIEQLVYALLPPNLAPRHSDFYNWLELAEHERSPDQGEVQLLRRVAAPWLAKGGNYGCLLDGINKVSLGGKVVHLELGGIAEGTPVLREVAATVVLNRIRSLIMEIPRNVRKRIVFEEMGSLLAIAGLGKMVREFFETQRKYNCQIIAVAQQFSSLGFDVASITANASLVFLFRQSKSSEVEFLKEAFQLPESASETLARFPDPSEARGAPFLCWKTSGSRVEIVTGYHVASPEMLYVSSSGGAHFERRKQDIAQYGGIMAAIRQRFPR